MRLILSVFFLILIYYNSSAQEEKLNLADRIKRIYEHNHLSFTIATNWTQKARTKSIVGPYQLGAQTMRGWEAGVNYHIHFRNISYSLILGLHGSAIPRNHTLFIPKEDFIPERQDDFSFDSKLTRTIDMYFNLPILIEKRWQGKKNNLWNLNAGITLGYFPDEIYEGWYYQGNTGQPPILDVDLLVSSNFRPWLNYMITGGHSWILRNNNILRINLQANYTSFNLAKGDYEIYLPGKPYSIGTYDSRLSGAGLSAQYILTQSRKQLLKKYKKDLKYRGF